MSSKGSTLPSLLEQHSPRGNKDHRVISHKVGIVQLFQTCSNHSTTHGTMPGVYHDLSSGWFNPPNLLKPLSFRGTKDHQVISHKLGVVQHFQTCLNCSTTDRTRHWMEVDMSLKLFNRTEPPRTTEFHREQGS